MSGRGTICLQSFDQVKLIKDIKNIFNKHKIKISENEIRLEKAKFTKTEEININIYSYKNNADNFLKKKLEIDKRVRSNKRALPDTKKVLRIKHSKIVAYLEIETNNKIDKKFRNTCIELLKIYKGLFIENENLFFDDTGCVLLDEDGDREYTKVEKKIEKEEPISFRFYAERKMVLNGYGITSDIPHLKESTKLQSNEEICKRLVALIVSSIKADDLYMGHSMAVANESARNVMKMFKSKRDWFTEPELEFLGSNRPTKEQIEFYAKGYDKVFALLFVIGLVEKFDLPIKKGNYDSLLEILVGIDSFESLLNIVRIRENLLMYLDIAYFAEWNGIKEIESTKYKEKINVDTAKGWHKALRWVYYNEDKW